MGYEDDLRRMESGKNHAKGIASLICGALLTAGAVAGIYLTFARVHDRGKVPWFVIWATFAATVLGPPLFYDGLWLAVKGVDVPLRRPPRTNEEYRFQKPYLGGIVTLVIVSFIAAVLVALD
jgi:amino acid transporter